MKNENDRLVVVSKLLHILFFVPWTAALYFLTIGQCKSPLLLPITVSSAVFAFLAQLAVKKKLKNSSRQPIVGTETAETAIYDDDVFAAIAIKEQTKDIASSHIPMKRALNQ